MSRTALIAFNDRSNPNIAGCQQPASSVKGKVQLDMRMQEEADVLHALPPLASLQAWVHRPQAVAKCTVGDVFAMRALGMGEGRVGRGDEVFLLNMYPCRMVEVVGWVASVDDKLDKMFITLDDGDGKHIISIHLRLQIHTGSTSKPTRPSTTSTPPRPSQLIAAPLSIAQSTKDTARSTFLSAQQRKIRRDKELAAAARLEARAAQIAAEESARKQEQDDRRGPKRMKEVFMPGVTEEYKGHRFARRDVRVGDTIRVVARVDEWTRRRAEGVQVVRGLWCDEAGGGKLEVVHPDEHFTHLAQVQQLRQTLYSVPFVMPKVNPVQHVHHAFSVDTCYAGQDGASRAPPSATVSPHTPSKRKLSTAHASHSSPSKRDFRPAAVPEQPDASSSYSYSDSLELNSTAYSEMSSFADHALPEVRSLRPSQLTENTYRRYVLDHMICQVQEAIEAITRQGEEMLDRALNAVFPEYTISPATQRDSSSERSQLGNAPSTPLREIQQGVKRYASLSRSSSGIDDEDTPKAFRSRATRQAHAAAAARSDISMCSSQEVWISPIKSLSSSPVPLLPVVIPTFTLDSLANIPHLSDLGGVIVDATAKTNERRRRRRIHDGEATDRDRAIEQERIAKGRRAEEYHLSKTERRKEVLRMTRRAIRDISEDGGIVQVASTGPSSLHISSQYSHSSSYTLGDISANSAYTAQSGLSRDVAYIPITPPLVLPLLQRFMVEEEARRQRHFLKPNDPRRGHGILIPDLTRRLTEYGQEGRWERVGEWNVEDALLWGCERGKVLRKGEGYRTARRDM